MDSIIFSAANLEARVRETILHALPPEKAVATLTALYISLSVRASEGFKPSHFNKLF
jgi:hypothetical protein